MHVTLVEINVKRTKLISSLRFSRQSPWVYPRSGNLRFDVLRDEHIPTRFYIYEAYTDEAAVAIHKTTPHYLQCVEQLAPLMTGPRKNGIYRPNALA